MIVNTRTRIICIVAVLLFAASFAGFIGMLFLIQNSERALEEYKIQIVKNQAYEQEFQALTRLVEESRAERDDIHSYVVADEEVIDFLALLEEIGREQGVELKTASLTVEPLKKPFEELTLTISVIGSYDRVVHVLKELEVLPYQSRISSVSLFRGGAAETDGTWSGEFKLHVTKYIKL